MSNPQANVSALARTISYRIGGLVLASVFAFGALPGCGASADDTTIDSEISKARPITQCSALKFTKFAFDPDDSSYDQVVLSEFDGRRGVILQGRDNAEHVQLGVTSSACRGAGKSIADLPTGCIVNILLGKQRDGKPHDNPNRICNCTDSGCKSWPN
jgi:hypothetical protein